MEEKEFSLIVKVCDKEDCKHQWVVRKIKENYKCPRCQKELNKPKK